MGKDLLYELSARRTHLQVSHRAEVVLRRMAMSTFDRDTPTKPGRVYWGGWRPLALQLGYDVDDGPLSNAAKLAVRRAVRELVEAKLIERYTEPIEGVPRTRAAYLIR